MANNNTLAPNFRQNVAKTPNQTPNAQGSLASQGMRMRSDEEVDFFRRQRASSNAQIASNTDWIAANSDKTIKQIEDAILAQPCYKANPHDVSIRSNTRSSGQSAQQNANLETSATNPQVTNQEKELTPAYTVIEGGKSNSAFSMLTDFSKLDESINRANIDIEKDPNQDPRVQFINSLYQMAEEEKFNIRNGTLKGYGYNIDETLKKTSRWDWIWNPFNVFNDNGLDLSLEADTKVTRGYVGKLANINEAEKVSRNELKEAIEAEKRGRQFQLLGNSEEAQKCYNDAKTHFDASANIIADSLTRTVNVSYADANAALAHADEVLTNWERGLRTARNGCVALGATIATGGVGGYLVAGGMSTAAGFSLGGLVGFGTGIAIGLGSSAGEVGAALGLGQTDLEGAVCIVLNNLEEDAKTSATAAASAAVGGGIASKLAKPGSKLLLTKTGRVLISVTSGAASSATSTTIELSKEFMGAVMDFQEQYKDYTFAEKREHFAEYMKERGLSIGDISYQYIHSIVMGSLCAGIGGYNAMAKQGAGALEKLARESGEAAVSVGIGIAAAYAKNGEITVEDAVSEIQNALISAAQGYTSQRLCDQAKFKNGKLTVEGETTEITVSAATIAGYEYVTTSNRKVLRRLYEAKRMLEVGQARAKAESEGVMAFVNPQNKQILIYDSGNKVITDSLKIHEDVHARGGSEADAYKAQLKHLHENRYTMDISNEGITIRQLENGEVPPKLEELNKKIDEFTKTKMDANTKFQTAKIREHIDENVPKINKRSKLDTTNKIARAGESELQELIKRQKNGEPITVTSQTLVDKYGEIQRGHASEILILSDIINGRKGIYHLGKVLVSDADSSTRIGLCYAEESINKRHSGEEIKVTKLSNEYAESTHTAANIFHEVSEKIKNRTDIDGFPHYVEIETEADGRSCGVNVRKKGNNLEIRAGGITMEFDTDGRLEKITKQREINGIRYYIDSDGNRKIHTIIEVKESVGALFKDDANLSQQYEQILLAKQNGAKKYTLAIGDGMIPKGDDKTIPIIGNELSSPNINHLVEGFKNMGNLPSGVEVEVLCGEKSLIWCKEDQTFHTFNGNQENKWNGNGWVAVTSN